MLKRLTAKTNNNKSRQLFAEFLTRHQFERLDNRNVFQDKGGKIGAFAFCSNANKLFCRQFYADCDFLVIMTADYTETTYPKKNLKIDKTPNRISPKGKVAYTARVC